MINIKKILFVQFLLVSLVASLAGGQISEPADEFGPSEDFGIDENVNPLDMPTFPPVSASLIPQYKQVISDQQFLVAVVLEITDPWYLYANPDENESYPDTQIQVEPVEGLVFGKPIYPQGKLYEDKVLEETYYKYTGRQVIYLPVEVAAAQPGEIALTVNVIGQRCSDQQCIQLEGENAITATTTIKIAAMDAAAEIMPTDPGLFEGIDVSAAFATASGTSEPMPAKTGEIAADNWLWAMLVALGAGLVMNLTPCVWPIIPIIILTLIKQVSGESEKAPVSRKKSITVGLVFAAGILLVFAALALVMSGFKLLWGQWFEGWTFKFVLLMVVFVLSLAMFGVFEIVLPARLTNISVGRKGYAGVFGMGMLATVLATPCGAPLMGSVLTWALQKPLPIMVLMFLLIGAGMAAPYVVLMAFPALLNRLPRSGNWMIRVKQIIGFAMIGFSIYLILLFQPQWRGALLYFCLILAFGVWLFFSVANHAMPAGKRWMTRLIAILIIAAGALWLAQPKAAPADSGKPQPGAWKMQLQQHLDQGKTVVVKFTADSCKNCKVLKKIVYERQEFLDKLAQTDAVLIIADKTYGDPEADEAMRAFNQIALPFTLVYPAKDPGNPIPLRDMHSMDDILKTLDEAAARK